MAVTGAIFNSLSFGGVNSADYGIYITGEAVYNAPRRAVELVSAPGRNGDIVIDQGRWENIEVQYPAGCFSDNTDFSEKISAFRNAIISQLGYQRLTDTYHPNEYRMAIYISGLEVQPANSNSAGEFDLIFNCKPQRWLTSGETAIAVTSGDTITNPTLFDSSPLLAIEGYGNVAVGGSDLTVYSTELGRIDMARTNVTQTYDYWCGGNQYCTVVRDYEFVETGFLEEGDTFYWIGGEYSVPFDNRNYELVSSSSGDYTGAPVRGTYIVPSVSRRSSGATSWSTMYYYIMVKIDQPVSFVYRTRSEVSDTATISVTYRAQDSSDVEHQYTTNYTISVSWLYNGADYVSMVLTVQNASQDVAARFNENLYYFVSDPSFYGISTRTPGTMYIDCDIAEAYFESDGAVLSANEYVNFVNGIPKLPPGTSTVDFENTISNMEVTPRWWKV